MKFTCESSVNNFSVRQKARVLRKVLYRKNGKMRFISHRDNRKMDRILPYLIRTLVTVAYGHMDHCSHYFVQTSKDAT